MLISSEGIVLRQTRITGGRRLINLFTRDYGKITAGTSLNEKGKSRAALALRPFTYSEYDIFKSKNSFNINSASVRESFYSIGEDMDRYFAASKLIEYIDSILEEGVPSPKLFEMTIECLRCMSESENGPRTLLYAFVIKSLRVFGVMPHTASCINCGREDVVLPVFSVTAGGLLCSECASLHGIQESGREPSRLIYEPSFDIVQVLDYFIKTPFRQFIRLNLKPEVESELEMIVSEYVSYYLGSDVFRNSVSLGIE